MAGRRRSQSALQWGLMGLLFQERLVPTNFPDESLPNIVGRVGEVHLRENLTRDWVLSSIELSTFTCYISVGIFLNVGTPIGSGNRDETLNAGLSKVKADALFGGNSTAFMNPMII